MINLIQANPTRYNEGVWLSTTLDGGTSMCFATLACSLAHLPVERLLCEDPTGDSIQDAARGLLGLTEDQASRLFDLPVDTTVDTLKDAITAVLGIEFR